MKVFFNFIHASNYLEAYSGVISHDIDIIILDYHMPGLNGVQLLNKLHVASEKRSPIVMITGGKEPDLEFHAYNLGVINYLEKSSLDSDSLFRALIDALKEYNKY